MLPNFWITNAFSDQSGWRGISQIIQEEDVICSEMQLLMCLINNSAIMQCNII